MSRLEAIVILAFIALIFSSLIDEPASVKELRNIAWQINCTDPICIVTRVQVGMFGDEALISSTKEKVMNGTVEQALAFLLVDNDADVRNNFSTRIDQKISQLKLGVTGSDDLILVANELEFRAENQGDEESRMKFDEITNWLSENGTEDFLYAYSYNLIQPKSNMSDANPSDAASLMLKISQQPLNSELLWPSPEQNFFAERVEKEVQGNATGKNLAEDICALSFYYSDVYPAVVMKESLLTIMAVYSIPLAIICCMSVISYLTSRGKGKSESFSRDYSKNIILTAMLVAILLPLTIQLSFLLMLFPVVLYLLFILPLLMLTVFYIWSSTNLMKEYGLIKVDRGKFLITRYKESFIIAFAGALIALISIFVISNIQKIFAYMNFGVVSALAVLLLLLFFSVFTVTLFPRFIEFTSSGHDIKSSKIKNRLKLLAGKLGYNVDSIRVIPSSGSSLANAFQSGLIGNNVKLFIFQTMLDRRKFSQRELEAVVAHELAHINKKHVLKTVFGYLMVACFVITLFIVIGLLLEAVNLPDMSNLLTASSPYIALLLAFLMTMRMMRQFEFEADVSAAEMGYAEDLTSALKKMDRYNLTPDNLSRLVAVFSSHADLKSRIRNLEKYYHKSPM